MWTKGLLEMINRQVLPSEQPQAVTRNFVPLAVIAAVVLAALLSAIFTLLYVSGASLEVIAAVVIGIWIGMCFIAAALLALPRD
jgi:hypothetical protein